jgi:hypothetical protein
MDTHTLTEKELREVIIRYRNASMDWNTELLTCSKYIDYYCCENKSMLKRTYFECDIIKVEDNEELYEVFQCRSCGERSSEEAVKTPENPLLFNHKLDCLYLERIPCDKK